MFHKRLLISGVCSGVGKTTAAIGIIAALKGRGLDVQPFKAGPDYIDTKYHEIVSGNKSYNLDGWLLTKEYITARFYEESSQHDISVIEGVMGLYDGYDGRTDEGSAAQLARWLDCPVILIVDVGSMARSAGAIVKGFEEFDRDVHIAGVIFNKVGSKRHFEILRQAVTDNCNAKVMGYLPRNDEISIPSRHLGLVTSNKDIVTPEFLYSLTTLIEEHIDMDAVLAAASSNGKQSEDKERTPFFVQPSFTRRVAVAYDEAFCFYYHDNFRIMESMGMELLFFSPLNDSALPDGIDGIYIGGGYPEIYAERLEKNDTMRNAVKSFAENGGVIYAECGGLLYLTKGIKTVDERIYEMAGVFPCLSRMLKKRKALGYVHVEIIDDCIVGRKGDSIRGHEYHYSTIADMPKSVERKYGLRKRAGEEEKKEGYSYKNVLASYVHLHFGTNPDIVRNFLFFLSPLL